MIKNIERINPIKRDKVKRGIKFIEDRCKIHPVIDKVVIFGSAIRDDCLENSDIDICIFSDFECTDKDYFLIRGSLSKVIGEKCDILKYNMLNDRFKTVIDNGVVVYER